MENSVSHLVQDDNIHSAGGVSLGRKVGIPRAAKKVALRRKVGILWAAKKGALGGRKALKDTSNSGKPSAALQASKKHNSQDVMPVAKDISGSKNTVPEKDLEDVEDVEDLEDLEDCGFVHDHDLCEECYWGPDELEEVNISEPDSEPEWPVMQLELESEPEPDSPRNWKAQVYEDEFPPDYFSPPNLESTLKELKELWGLNPLNTSPPHLSKEH